MGLNIRDIVPKKEFSVSELKGKVVCVDAFNVLYQFVSTIRQQDGTPLMDNKKRITSHLSGIFYRNINLIEEGIKLVYVFDGTPPDLKYKTHEKRKEVRDVAKEKYEHAKDMEDIEGMRRYSMSLTKINDEMIKESKELLNAMGICVIQSPGEGEAGASYLTRKHNAYATISQDYDSLLFGTPKLIQNLTMARRRKTATGWIEIKPELIDLGNVLNSLEIDLDQLICLGILVGTDYNPKGIPGVGQKKALQIVKQYKQPVLIFKSVEEQMNNLSEQDSFDWQEIFSLFKKPNVTDFDFKFPKVDEEKIKDILVREHDFSLERVEKQLERLRDAKEKSKQATLKF
ncbi:flap endonuclease-1 [Candidatus Pacearchaeota archaeon CG10_big_fil_rev_8_21_14_0_10_32_14]|nr:MAG: flap endonuclease-1 [Candidatus Pacearchaeota archaeon CG10_big_fil_rev_8_21_14_0_10_32_14]